MVRCGDIGRFSAAFFAQNSPLAGVSLEMGFMVAMEARGAWVRGALGGDLAAGPALLVTSRGGGRRGRREEGGEGGEGGGEGEGGGALLLTSRGARP